MESHPERHLCLECCDVCALFSVKTEASEGTRVTDRESRGGCRRFSLGCEAKEDLSEGILEALGRRV